MIQGFYTAATGLTAALKQQETLSQNLAHSTVPGYRRQSLAFSTFDQAMTQAGASSPSPASPANSPQGTQVSQDYTDFGQGEYVHTGNPLECSVRGDGFFVLQGPEGPVYTRNGSFLMNGRGELQSATGLPVNGTAGRITIPPGTARITIAQDGSVSANGNPVGQLQLASFADPRQLTRVGTTLFSAPPDQPPQKAQGTVMQGYREGSNVQIVQEMVNMIAGMRYYEATTRALHSLSGTVQQRTQGQV